MASGGKADRYDQMQGDMWLSSALRTVVSILNEPFDYESDSLQSRLVEMIDERSPEIGIRKKFVAALENREKNLQEIAARILTGQPYATVQQRIRKSATLKVATMAPGLPGILEKAHAISEEEEYVDARETALLRLAAYMPDLFEPSPAFRQLMDGALIGKRGGSLNMDFAKELRRAKENKKPLGISDAEIVLTVNLTNPEFPLWLAESKAMSSIITHVFNTDPGGSDGTEAIKQLRIRKLKCSQPYPILDFQMYREGNSEFVMAPGFEAAPPLKNDGESER